MMWWGVRVSLQALLSTGISISHSYVFPTPSFCYSHAHPREPYSRLSGRPAVRRCTQPVFARIKPGNQRASPIAGKRNTQTPPTTPIKRAIKRPGRHGPRLQKRASLSVARGALPRKHPRALTKYQFDYFGPSIDTGFRVVGHATQRFFTMSIEVAWALALDAQSNKMKRPGSDGDSRYLIPTS